MNSVGPSGTNGTCRFRISMTDFRWEITNPSTSSGVFSLLLRQGDDTQTSKQVVETYSNHFGNNYKLDHTNRRVKKCKLV